MLAVIFYSLFAPLVTHIQGTFEPSSTGFEVLMEGRAVMHMTDTLHLLADIGIVPLWGRDLGSLVYPKQKNMESAQSWGVSFGLGPVVLLFVGAIRKGLQ